MSGSYPFDFLGRFLGFVTGSASWKSVFFFVVFEACFDVFLLV